MTEPLIGAEMSFYSNGTKNGLVRFLRQSPRCALTSKICRGKFPSFEYVKCISEENKAILLHRVKPDN